MVDGKSQKDNEPKPGVVRIMGSNGEAESQDGQGRIEIFMNGGWGAICSNGWTKDSANVACK